jgi:uncharacterized protein
VFYVKKLATAWALLCLCAAALSAVDFASLKPQGYVSDFAGVVDAGSRARLEDYAARLEKATGVQSAYVTLPDLAGEPVDQVANDLFRKWGIGHKGKDDGVLLLLSIQDHRSRLEVGYGLEPAITDGMAGDVLRAMRPYLREGRYGDAMLQAAEDMGARIAKARNVSVEAPPVEPARRRQRESPIPFGVLIGGVILFFILSSIIGGRGGRGSGGSGIGGLLTGMLLGNLMRGGGGRGGGGFGGFDSGGGGGGGFGGFGGGDSGGGGASSDW